MSPSPRFRCTVVVPTARDMCLQFANVEEDYADNAVWSMNLLARDQHVMPWRIEDGMKRIGANYVQAGLWRGFAARQQPGDWAQNFSTAETTAKLVEVLGQ